LSHLHQFLKSHGISNKADISSIEVAVYSVSEVNAIVYGFISNIDNKTNKNGFVLHSHLNILSRIFEQTEGMLVCICSRCPTSAEALARVVVESSINIMFMVLHGNEQTLIGFLDTWIIEHKRKLNEWKEKMVGSIHAKRVLPMIDKRLSLINNLEKYLNKIVITCGIERKPHRKAWPKSVFKRFSALDRETDYYESYHRLSGSSHLSGEDTLSWLIALNMDDEYKYTIAKEAVSYSIMMSRIASLFFIDAAVACAIFHGLEDLEDIKYIKNKLIKSVSDITKEAGVPE